KLARHLNIDFFSVRKKVSQYAVKERLSVEEAGREIRYGIFESYRKKFNYNKIATAHNSSDNAETVLLNLIKGTGMKGISGIPERRDKIIRPILVLTKEEILEYLEKEKISYRTDATNLNTGYDRNFIRHKIIPEIKKRMNPALEHTLFNSSEVFRSYSGLIEKLIKEKYPGIVRFKDKVLHFSIKGIEALDNELRGEIFKSALGRNFSVQIMFNDFKKFSALIKKQTGSTEDLSGHLSALKERDEILILKIPARRKFNPIEVKEGEKIKAKDKVLSITRRKKPAKLNFNKDKDIEYISGDNLSRVFILRNWVTGDRFYPLGFHGSKKVSDFLNDQKIPSYLKKNQLVLTNRNRIVWILGLRLDDRFKILKDTKKVLELCLK
ncbi:MAG TPA: tRNA lysidine(34) synthetase TilS, partial [Ignavibacteriaceae bacterium]|nr:tRNA lysidine(34) synthetase TilS [Ignavibacteriaceae bacterium]